MIISNYVTGTLIVIIVITGGVWFVMNGQEQGAAISSEQSNQKGILENAHSISSLAAKRGSWQCDATWLGNGSLPHSPGTVFISEGKVRGDFDAGAQPGESQQHLISDGEFVYVWDVYDWTRSTFGGVKTKITAGSSGTADGPDFYYQTYDFHCSPWSPDNAKFTIPSNVIFTEIIPS